MKRFHLLVLAFLLAGVTSCSKENARISTGKGIINGENYKYESAILNQIMAPDPYEAYLYEQNGVFVFRTGEMGFLPANGNSASPNFMISFSVVVGVQNFVTGEKYYIADNGESGENYTTDCRFHRYRWEDGISYDELGRYGNGSVEFTRIDKENGWTEGLFEFDVPPTDEYEHWTANCTFKLNTQVSL